MSEQPDPKPELMPADKLFERGVQYHRSGHLLAAQDIYRQLLEVFPEHPDVLHFLGVVSHQLGESDEALKLFDKALRIIPDHPDLHVNRANVLLMQRRLEEAAAACQRALELQPENPNAANSLGIVYRRLGQLNQAEQQFRSVLRMASQHREARRNLCRLLQLQGRGAEAVEIAREGVLGHPSDSLLYGNLVHCLQLARRYAEAERVLREWLEFDPQNIGARHLIQAYQKGPPPKGSEPRYVEALFDDFAETYDDVLQRLKYVGPQALSEYLAAQLPPPANQYLILDAGCGTGLCGPVLRSYAQRLTGLDLSARMLAHARQSGCYDDLVKQEIVQFLQTGGESFDLIVASDVLSYFGDLSDFLAGSRQRLRPEGHLLFLLEKADDDGPEYALQPHGRFSHRDDYLRRAIETAGLHVAGSRELILRHECGEPVAGLLYHARRHA